MRQTLIVDASFNHESGATGIGIVIHETDKQGGGRNGVVIDQLSEAYIGIPDGLGEMLALYRAMQISRERGYKSIKLRSDFNAMRTALKKSYENQTDFDRVGLYGEVLRLSIIFESIKFGFKPRRKNQMAHRLARIGAKEMSPIRDRSLIEMCCASSLKLTRRSTGAAQNAAQPEYLKSSALEYLSL